MAASLQMTRVSVEKKNLRPRRNPHPAFGYHASKPPITIIIAQPHGGSQNPARCGRRLPARPEEETTRRIWAPKVANQEGFKKENDIFHLPLNSALRAGSTQTQATLAAAEDSFPSWKMETGGGSLAQLRRHIEGDGGARWS